ncbi:Stp1/IreP family PP2C-type Ser/Thr phosphatase [Actinomycetaceae bacterium TAE3-ERU4]|nr:Stp1/IreP family PP2C-type Ser/Thr phosphatase [Actinomycetaceae bacterium TAE3-ERU4]
MSVEIRYAALSDVGLVRKNNQDSGYAGQHLLVLADGMGGPAGGDIASSVAVAHLAPLDQDSYPAEELLPALTKALNDAHDELISRSRRDPDLEGMGTTCIAILRSSNKMAMLHIGDSRAFRLRDGQLTQVTKDHSFVQYLVDTGQISPEEAQNHPQKNVVLRVLGDQDEPLLPDESLREAIVGDRWLLCSDGLSGVVSTETINEVMTSTPNLEECAQKLVHLALRAGGPDNITVVLFDVISSSADILQSEPQVVGAAATDRLAKSAATGFSSARAAALGASTDSVAPSDEDKDTDLETSSRRGRKIAKWVGSFLFLLALVGGVFAGYSWSQSQYYAIAEGDAIVIYQGIPQSLGPISLSHPVSVKKYKVSDLSPALRTRLETPVTRSSRQALDTYLDSLVTEDGWRRLNEDSPQVILPGQTPSVPPTASSPEAVPQLPGLSVSPTPSAPKGPDTPNK